MNIFLIVFVVAAIFSLIAFLWLTMAGFKRSTLWGVLVLLFSPIGAVAFAVTNWLDARKPFLVYIFTFLLMCGSAGLIASEAGMHNLQQIGQRLGSGKLEVAQAYNLLNKAMAQNGAQDLFANENVAPPPTPQAGQAMTNPAADSAPANAVVAAAPAGDEASAAKTTLAAAETVKANAKPAVKADAVAPMPAEREADIAKAEKKAAKQDVSPEAAEDTKQVPAKPAVPKYPSMDKVEPDPLAQKKKKEEPNTVAVSVNKLHNYVGHYFIVTLKSGAERRGLLTQVDDSKMVVVRKLYGGNLQYRIYKSQIKSIQMLKHPPEEK